MGAVRCPGLAKDFFRDEAEAQNHNYNVVTNLTVSISIVKPTRCTISQIYFILVQHSKFFGRSLRPSKGV